ncbi:MAG TPA: hypothetical protein VFS47_11995, partial [Steroidobacteraceae bacterium]|nr:hypothetical protein [Steroidobacteraceae bacterium]
MSPYLPLNVSPEIERQIERVMILADQPVMSRPIAAAQVLDALPAACEKDPALCKRVRRFLDRYMARAGIVTASVDVAAASGDGNFTMPNQQGRTIDDAWGVSAEGYWQPFDHLLVSVGGTAYEGNATPAGTLVSLGFSKAQLDIGYRKHWFSPSPESSLLMSTEAEALPSVTLSNYEPLTRFGIRYELFLAQMDYSDKIAWSTTGTV